MFMTKRKHDRLMKIADNYAGTLAEEGKVWRDLAEALSDENQQLTAELAQLRAARARANANLKRGGGRKSDATQGV